jgi:hypothetical protein
MSKKGTGKVAATKAVPKTARTVEFLLQSAYLTNARVTLPSKVERTEYDGGFADGKIIIMTGPKATIFIAEMESFLSRELSSCKDDMETVEFFSFLKTLPEKLYPNATRCNELLRAYRSGEGNYLNVKSQVIKCEAQLFQNCFSLSQAQKEEASMVLHEALCAFLWNVYSISSAPIKDIDQYSNVIQSLVDRAIVTENTSIHRVLLSIKDKFPVPSTAAKKPAKKSTISEATPPASAQNEDAADILNEL